jgi:hypothetical protein
LQSLPPQPGRAIRVLQTGTVLKGEDYRSKPCDCPSLFLPKKNAFFQIGNSPPLPYLCGLKIDAPTPKGAFEIFYKIFPPLGDGGI